MVMYDIAYETVYKENTTLTRSCLLRYGNVSRVEFFEFCLLFFFFLVFVLVCFLSEIVNRKLRVVQCKTGCIEDTPQARGLRIHCRVSYVQNRSRTHFCV